MEFSNLRDQVHSLNQAIGGQWKANWQLLWIYEELGELSSELQKFEKLPAKLHDESDEELRQKMLEELGDVIYGIVSLSKSLDLDPVEALEYSLKKFQKRHKKNNEN